MYLIIYNLIKKLYLLITNALQIINIHSVSFIRENMP